MRLRRCEEGEGSVQENSPRARKAVCRMTRVFVSDGEDDSFMDELMVEWFNLIRNKQVAMRRESELVYM